MNGWTRRHLLFLIVLYAVPAENASICACLYLMHAGSVLTSKHSSNMTILMS